MLPDSPAALLAARLRTAAKDQALSGSDIADRVERLTGVRPSATWLSRRVGTAADPVPLLRVSPDLFVLAGVLGLDPMDLIEDVLRSSVDMIDLRELLAENEARPPLDRMHS